MTAPDRPAPSDAAEPLVLLRLPEEVVATLRAKRPSRQVEAMREAVLVWAPLHDRIVALFLETVEDGAPCRRFPDDWSSRARLLLADHERASREHRLCSKPHRPTETYARLRAHLGRLLDDPAGLPAADVLDVGRVLLASLGRHGEPAGPRRQAVREAQERHAARPSHAALAHALATRIEERGDPGPLDPGLPPHLARLALRCAPTPIGSLLAEGVIGSGEALADAIPHFPRSRDGTRRLLQTSALLTVTSFPERMTPIPLVWRLRGLAADAGQDLPLSDELRPDWFLTGHGSFTRSDAGAARLVARHLAGSLYADYYDLPVDRMLHLVSPEAFGRLCQQRATAGRPRPDAPWNAAVIEQSEILTTHNLSPLVHGLGLLEEVAGRAPDLALRCFTWCIHVLERRSGDRWGRKRAADAWRQMIVFLSLIPGDEAMRVLDGADDRLAARHGPAVDELGPAVRGLRAVAAGTPDGSRPLLGWS